MEFILKVELGETTVALIERILNTKAGVAPLVVKASPEDVAKLQNGLKQSAPAADLFSQEAATEEKPEAPKRTRRSKAEIEAEKADQEVEAEKAPAQETVKKEAAAPTFADMDEDAQLEAIKAEVTRNTKKGKSADIKALLAFFDAGRASELAADQYPDFYDMVKRYSAGETVDALTGGDLD